MKIGKKLLRRIVDAADSPKPSWRCYTFAALTQLALFGGSAVIQGESEALWTIFHVSGAFLIAVMGGRGPGYLAGGLAAFSVDYHYIRPLWHRQVSPAGIAFFVLTLLIITATLFIVGILQRAMKETLQSKKIADDSVRKRDEAMAVIAHDLRQPISTLLLQAEVTKCALDQGIKMDAAAKLRKTVSTLRRMDRLIQDLLDSAKMDSGQLCLAKEEVNLCALTSGVVNDYLGQAEQKAINLELKLPKPELPAIRADKHRLIRVISNLVANSVKFTPNGGQIEIALEMPDDGHEQFRISNNGPPIPEEEVPNLFKRNWQEKKTAHLGNGLGLYICHGIIQAHQGTIWYEYSSHSGATFCFRLPVAGALSASASPETERKIALS